MNLEEIREERTHKIGNIVKYFGAVMGLFYMVLGTGMLLGKIPLIANNIIKYGLGTALLLYGIIRLYRIIKK